MFQHEIESREMKFFFRRHQRSSLSFESFYFLDRYWLSIWWYKFAIGNLEFEKGILVAAFANRKSFVWLLFRHGHRMELFFFHHFGVLFLLVRVLWVNIVFLSNDASFTPLRFLLLADTQNRLEVAESTGSLEKRALFAHGEKSAKSFPLRNWANVKD